ncbi:MAG TPA: hypothetical protein VGQ83_32495 [Polyangia bacterium]|jgi:hypothetical protein
MSLSKIIAALALAAVAAGAPVYAQNNHDPGNLMGRYGAFAAGDVKKLERHLSTDVSYPATKADVVSAMNKEKDLSPQAKDFIDKKLTKRTYHNPTEVLKALGLTQ